MSSVRCHILVCRGPACSGQRLPGVERNPVEAGRADAIFERFHGIADEHGLTSQWRLDRQSCFGRCRYGPNVYISYPDDRRMALGPTGSSVAPLQPRPRAALYHHVTVPDVDTIVNQHILGGHVVAELTRRKADLADRFASSPGSSFPENG